MNRRIVPRAVIPLFSALLLLSLLLLPLPRVAQARPLPSYDFDVRVNSESHLVSGVVRVRLPDEDPRPAGAWWFHLPPNRFSQKDPRGFRRVIQALPIGLNFTKKDPLDPMFPDGFDEGWIEIVGVRDEANRPLSFSFEDNPAIPTGFSMEKGLLRVDFHPDSSGRMATLEFVTHLPNRHWEGWNDEGIFAERWHPLLAAWAGGDWDKDVFAVEAAHFQGYFVFENAGWMQLGSGKPLLTESEVEHRIMAGQTPAPSLPIVFLRGAQTILFKGEEVTITAFFFDEKSRVGLLALRRGAGFFDYMSSLYGLSFPGKNLTLIQSDLPTGEIWVAGRVIYIPTVYFKNSPILDRVFVAKLSRAIAEIWFGHSVLSNRDKEAWLHLGLTGFLSLEYYERLYGWDSGIHELVDWLSPKYREHYFESITLGQMRNRRETPLTISLYSYPHTRDVITTYYHRAPLVFRSLKYVTGEEAFRRGLAAFYNNYLHQSATATDFIEAVEGEYGQSLKWYFDQFFYDIVPLDYSLANWSQEAVEDKYRVEISVERRARGIMPVDLEVTTEDGGVHTRRLDGKAKLESVEMLLSSPVKEIVLDPKEFLLESDRKNNYSSGTIRLRPIYDWSKEKETLITVVARAGGNAIDGNFIGLGANVKFDHDHQLSVIPIDGQKNNDLLYEVSFLKSRFIKSNTTFFILWQKLGGQKTVSPGLKIYHYSSDFTHLKSTMEMRLEEVEPAPPLPATANFIQDPGRNNNLFYQYDMNFSLGTIDSSDFFFNVEHSQPTFGSDFHYTVLGSSLGHTQVLHPNHAIRAEILRGMTEGSPPVQKLHLLGDPLVLRGFPRTVNLVYDNIAAFRLEYHYVLTRRIFGETFQTRKIDLILFGDVGRGWDNKEEYNQALTRKDAGFGVNFDVDTLSMLDFPIRLEIAFPIDDPEYHREQFIFFQALSFF